MQHYALTLDKLIDHAAKWHGDRPVVSAENGLVSRAGYREVRARSNALSGALQAIGLSPGERLGTLAWNSRAHLELFYATAGIGLVCHTLNPRLPASHLAPMLREAGARVLAVAADLLPLAAALAMDCPAVERMIVIDGAVDQAARAALPPAVTIDTLEALLASHGAPARWGEVDEEAPAGLCYTSGTTGAPKGVVFTHRANYLHALTAIQPDGYCLSARDVILAAVPMFHANGWGLPFSAPAVGAALVLPGRDLDGASLAALIAREGVTLACGVHTVWLGLLDHVERTGIALPTLERIIVGGARCPDALVARLEAGLGVRVQTSWGMTELSPIGTVEPLAAPRRRQRAAGRPLLGVDLLLTDAEGRELPVQRGTVGHLKVRGASVIERYFRAEHDAIDVAGWFDTGDLASIDAAGDLKIEGRSKDLIKSGGEWINPAEIETIATAQAGVRQAAVVAAPHARWGERPVLIVEPHDGAAIDPDALIAVLRTTLPRWWLPDEVLVVAPMPLAPTGKIDKAKLRAAHAAGELGQAWAA